MSPSQLVSRGSLIATLFVALSTPLQAQWTNVTANLANLPSECGNLCLLSAVPGQDKIIAGIAQRGLWQTIDGGITWTPLGQGPGSDVIVNRPSQIVYDPNNSDFFWESGIYNRSGVYQTTNGGQTFRHLGRITHNDSVSVDLADPRRQTLLAGGHEQSRTVWKSLDRGETWTNVGVTLPEGTKFSTNPLLIDRSTYLVNASGWGKGTGGVFRASDGGATWTQVSEWEANGAPLRASDGSIYWPLMAGRGVVRSTDQGQSWMRVCGPGVIKGERIIELPDGRLATAAGKGIKVSADRGASWTVLLEPSPIQPSGVIYVSARNAFYIWQWDCGNRVLTNAIWRHDWRIDPKPAR